MSHKNTDSTDTTTTIGSACHTCGTIGKSGKSSCCGRGGSWFKNCGSSGNTKLHHTWFEGIQVCKSRTLSKTVIAQQKGIGSFHGADMANYKAFTTSVQTLMTNTSTNILMVSSTQTSASTSIIVQGFEILLKTIVHIDLLFIFVF